MESAESGHARKHPRQKDLISRLQFAAKS